MCIKNIWTKWICVGLLMRNEQKISKKVELSIWRITRTHLWLHFFTLFRPLCSVPFWKKWWSSRPIKGLAFWHSPFKELWIFFEHALLNEFQGNELHSHAKNSLLFFQSPQTCNHIYLYKTSVYLRHNNNWMLTLVH